MDQQPLPGTDIVATVPWNVPPENPDRDRPVSVYYAALPLDPSKTVRFVTFPTNLNLHVFRHGHRRDLSESSTGDRVALDGCARGAVRR